MIPSRHAVVIMGVSGAGKTTIGTALADSLGLDFVDADDLHPVANIEKMAGGTPLTDSDRGPWLDRVAAQMVQSASGTVTACSALKRGYRDRIRAARPDVLFVHLDGSRDLIDERMRLRQGHFMAPSLVSSQFEALDPLGSGERGLRVDAGLRPAVIVQMIAGVLHHELPGSERS